VFLLALAVLVLLILPPIVLFGGVFGTEFNPDTFERRSFAFYEMPWIGIQMTSINRHDNSGLVEEHVRAQKYVVPQPVEPERWSLIKLERSSGNTMTGDANLLTQYLDARLSGANSSGWSGRRTTRNSPKCSGQWSPRRRGRKTTSPCRTSFPMLAGNLAAELQKSLDDALAKHAPRQ